MPRSPAPMLERCSRCGLETYGTAVVHAAGRRLHEHCFCCDRCGRPFERGNFVPMAGELVCVDCRDKQIGPWCAACGGSLAASERLVAMDTLWHPECFRCASCSTVLENGYHAREGAAYCARCHEDKFAERCVACGDAVIDGDGIIAEGELWHSGCFVCSACAKRLVAHEPGRGSEEKLFLTPTRPQRSVLDEDADEDEEDGGGEGGAGGGSVRGHEPAAVPARRAGYGRYLAVSGRTPGRTPLSGSSLGALGGADDADADDVEGTYYVLEGRPFCREHYLDALTPECTACAKPIREDRVAALGGVYHGRCFACVHCKMPIGDARFIEHDGRAYCEPDYYAIFGGRAVADERPPPLVEHAVMARVRADATAAFAKAHESLWAEVARELREDGLVAPRALLFDDGTVVLAFSLEEGRDAQRSLLAAFDKSRGACAQWDAALQQGLVASTHGRWLLQTNVSPRVLVERESAQLAEEVELPSREGELQRQALHAAGRAGGSSLRTSASAPPRGGLVRGTAQLVPGSPGRRGRSRATGATDRLHGKMTARD